MKPFRIRLEVLLLGAAIASPALAQDSTYSDGYADGAYGRIRYEENGLTVRRASAGVQDAAGRNAPIYPGDRVFTSSRQRAEIQLAGGTLIRVDEMGDLTFLALPDPYATYPDNTVLQLQAGAMRVTSTLSTQEEFRVDTPAGSIYLLGDGDFRIELTSDGRTLVSSRRGVAEVSAAGGSVIVRGGNRTELFVGSLPDDPVPFNSFAGDDFDRWVAGRDAAYESSFATGGPSDEAYGSLPDEVSPYYNELSAYGDWIYADGYGYVWRPSGVNNDWRPYYHGYWDYGPGGYFWVSNEPWGWAPYHYGRWSYISGYGWGWMPGRVFAGGWVVWSWGSAYVGWSARGYWGGPAYYGPVHYGYYSAGCWAFVPYHGFHHKHYSYYSVHDVGSDLGRSAIVTRPPDVSPQRLASSPEVRKIAQRQAANSALEPTLPSASNRASVDQFRAAESRALSGLIGTSGTATATRAAPLTSESATAPRRTLTSTRSEPGSVNRVAPTARQPESYSLQPNGIQRRSAPGKSLEPTPRRSEPTRQPGASLAPSRRQQAGPVAPRTDPREIYRRLSVPRTPEKRSTASGSPRSTDRSRSTTTSGPSRSGTATGSRARPSSPSRKSGASPSRSSGSRSSGSKSSGSRSSGSKSSGSRSSGSKSSGSRSSGKKSSGSRSKGR